MDVHHSIQHHKQPPLFEYFSTALGVSELFPAVWGALEKIIINSAEGKKAALDVLLEHDAIRLSPLVAYVLITRITDPDLVIRSQVIKMIGDALVTSSNGKVATEEVRQVLTHHLSQMRTRQIFSILQALVYQDALMDHAGKLMNFSPYAGSHLANLVNSRQTPLEIRQQAIKLIGYVGYLDALPDLERIMIRLESRMNGQQAMPFAPLATSKDEIQLLPDLMQTIDILRSA